MREPTKEELERINAAAWDANRARRAQHRAAIEFDAVLDEVREACGAPPKAGINLEAGKWDVVRAKSEGKK